MLKHYRRSSFFKGIGFAATILFNLSCADHTPDPGTGPGATTEPGKTEKLLMSMTDNNQVTTNIEYDGEKRPVKYSNKNETITFTYSKDLVIRTEILAGGNKSNELILELKDGLVIKRTSNDYNGAQSVVNTNITNFEYSNGRLIRERSINNGVFARNRESHYDSQGNLEHWQYYDIDNKPIIKVTFTYYDDLDKSGEFGEGNFDSGTGKLYSKMSKFLTKTVTWEQNNKSELYQYTYEFDSERYVTKTVVNRDGKLISSWTNVWK